MATAELFSELSERGWGLFRKVDGGLADFEGDVCRIVASEAMVKTVTAAAALRDDGEALTRHLGELRRELLEEVLLAGNAILRTPSVLRFPGPS